jgi:hypothetical protein
MCKVKRTSATHRRSHNQALLQDKADKFLTLSLRRRREDMLGVLLGFISRDR